MRRHRHPLLSRIATAIGAIIALATLATLGLLRPPLPHIASLTAPLSEGTIRDGALCLAWLLALYLAIVLLIHAARVTIRGPAWQREAILPGIIPNPPEPRPSTPLSERFQPAFPLTLTRPDTPQKPAEAQPSAPAATPTVEQTPTPRQQPELSISLLGPLRIDGARRPPKRVPTRELIAYLALHPNGASRDELIEAIWPAQDPKRTRPRLWESASDAKAALGDAWIVDGERYRLDRDRLQIDLDQLDQLLSRTESDDDAEPPNLEAALALWRGEPLQGSDYAWADGHIHRLQATLIGLLERTGHARLDRGDPRGALQLAEQAIALDQFHEASWRLALQADYALGLRESITRRYNDLARALDQQLGLQPTRETRIVYRQLLGQN
jgi:DNA-binding SARP family transcriptional activator